MYVCLDNYAEKGGVKGIVKLAVHCRFGQCLYGLYSIGSVRYILLKIIFIYMVISRNMVCLGRMTSISMRVLYTAHCTLFEDLT